MAHVVSLVDDDAGSPRAGRQHGELVPALHPAPAQIGDHRVRRSPRGRVSSIPVRYAVTASRSRKGSKTIRDSQTTSGARISNRGVGKQAGEAHPEGAHPLGRSEEPAARRGGPAPDREVEARAAARRRDAAGHGARRWLRLSSPHFRGHKAQRLQLEARDERRSLERMDARRPGASRGDGKKPKR